MKKFIIKYWYYDYHALGLQFVRASHPVVTCICLMPIFNIFISYKSIEFKIICAILALIAFGPLVYLKKNKPVWFDLDDEQKLIWDGKKSFKNYSELTQIRSKLKKKKNKKLIEIYRVFYPIVLMAITGILLYLVI